MLALAIFNLMLAEVPRFIGGMNANQLTDAKHDRVERFYNS